MPDYRFYKYTRISENALTGLRNGTIYFARQKCLNDPFDCELDIAKAIRNAADQSNDDAARWLRNLLKREALFKKFQENLNELGICSFSGDMSDLQTLLWSHYGDSHKGMCILYEFPMEFLDDEDNILGVSKVTYEPDALTEWFRDLAARLPVSDKDLIIGLLQRVLTAKSPRWKYENEARIIRPQAGPYEIEKSFVKQICFGLQASDDNIGNVKDAMDDYPCKVHQFRAIRGHTDFGIDFEEI